MSNGNRRKANKARRRVKTVCKKVNVKKKLRNLQFWLLVLVFLYSSTASFFYGLKMSDVAPQFIRLSNNGTDWNVDFFKALVLLLLLKVLFAVAGSIAALSYEELRRRMKLSVLWAWASG